MPWYNLNFISSRSGSSFLSPFISHNEFLDSHKMDSLSFGWENRFSNNIIGKKFTWGRVGSGGVGGNGSSFVSIRCMHCKRGIIKHPKHYEFWPIKHWASTLPQIRFHVFYNYFCVLCTPAVLYSRSPSVLYHTWYLRSTHYMNQGRLTLLFLRTFNLSWHSHCPRARCPHAPCRRTRCRLHLVSTM